MSCCHCHSKHKTLSCYTAFTKLAHTWLHMHIWKQWTHIDSQQSFQAGTRHTARVVQGLEHKHKQHLTLQPLTMSVTCTSANPQCAAHHWTQEAAIAFDMPHSCCAHSGAATWAMENIPRAGVLITSAAGTLQSLHAAGTTYVLHISWAMVPIFARLPPQPHPGGRPP